VGIRPPYLLVFTREICSEEPATTPHPHPDPPARDLDDPAQIAELVRRFYADVAQDDVLGPVFNDVAKVDWSEHLPKLRAFWCRALLGISGYVGNPFRAHAGVHAQRAFTPRHFQRWLDLFEENVALGWRGPNAERAVQLARDVARVHRQQLLGIPAPQVQVPSASPREGSRSA
jgi:hemoglobin